MNYKGKDPFPREGEGDHPEPDASQDLGSHGLLLESPWMRWALAVCAAIGIALAIVIVTKQPCPPTGQGVTGSACGGCQR
jgi:hypothetical protein